MKIMKVSEQMRVNLMLLNYKEELTFRRRIFFFKF